jgi:hypothetical protein
MSPSFWPGLERAATVLLAVCFAAPLALTAYFHFVPDARPATAWLRNATLGGDPYHPRVVHLSLASVRRGTYQAALADDFNHAFAGRELLVRLLDETYLRVFRATTAEVIVGRGRSLFQNEAPSLQYVSEYSVHRSAPDSLKWLAGDLRRFQDNCARRGVACVLLITPSKAATYPEDLPGAWLRRQDPRPRDYDNFVRLLHAAKVRFVDGPRLVRAAKGHTIVPVFPPGGVHWSDPGALPAANAVLESLAAQGQDVHPLRDVSWTLGSYQGVGLADNDADLASLCNFALPWTYPVAAAHITPAVIKEEGHRPTLVLVGGSFLGKVAKMLQAGGQFEEIDWLRYYDGEKFLMLGQGAPFLLSPAPRKVNVAREVFAADNVVLEVNEQFLMNPWHLENFFHDVLPRLPAPSAPRRPYLYESALPCTAGKTLSFAGGSSVATNRIFWSGFSDPEPRGTWTDGDDAIGRLSVRPPGQDAQLLVDLAPALDPAQSPPRQQVRVFLNGQPVADWEFLAPGPVRREATLPRQLLRSGLCALRFHIAHPVVPGPDDPRHLGLFFADLTLNWANDLKTAATFSAGPNAMDRRLLTGFSATPRPRGLWTQGDRATIRLIVPKPDAEMEVQVAARAALDPSLTPPGQRVSVFANGVPVDQWDFTDDQPTTRELFIPPDVVGSGGCVLGFRIAHPVARNVRRPNDTGGRGLLLTSLKTNVPLQKLLPCAWGQPISFVAGSAPFAGEPGFFTGFSYPEAAGTWTDGTDATARLLLPQPAGDVTLQANLLPALDNRQSPPSQHVDVFVNDEPLAGWDFVSPEFSRRELVLPRRLVQAGRCVVRFQIADPVNPPNDGRRLGVFLSSLVFKTPGQ